MRVKRPESTEAPTCERRGRSVSEGRGGGEAELLRSLREALEHGVANER